MLTQVALVKDYRLQHCLLYVWLQVSHVSAFVMDAYTVAASHIQAMARTSFADLRTAIRDP